MRQAGGVFGELEQRGRLPGGLEFFIVDGMRQVFSEFWW